MAKAAKSRSNSHSNGKNVVPTSDKKEQQPTTLLEAIMALGGSAEDFDLVGGEESDDNEGAAVDGKKSKDVTADEASLQKELRGLVKELAFDQLEDRGQDFQESDSAPESGDDSDESESESEEEQMQPEQHSEAPNSKPEPIVQTKLPSPTPPQSQPKPTEQTPSSSKEPATKQSSDPVKVKAPTGPWLVAPHPIWHEIELPELPVAPQSYNLHPNRLTQLQERADELLTELNQQYSDSLSPSSKTTGKSKSRDPQDYSTLSKADKSFIVTILKSGTSSDKLSALTLLASSSPLHCTSHLSQLLSLCSKRSRQEATKAIQSVVDWLKHQGLPSSRKLTWFADQPRLRDVAFLQQPKGKQPKDQKWKAGDQHLVVWAFEAWLKKWFLDVLRALETHANDPLPFVRTQMTGHFYELLSQKPEQEHNLLRLLVHKLGDLHRPLASKTSYFLLSLLQENPGMKPIVIREVASLVLRPASSLPKSRAHQDHSAYYGIIMLNQILLSRNEPQVAAKLIDVYFEIFTDMLARIDRAKDAVEQASGKKRKKGSEKKEDLEVKVEQEEEGDSKMLAAVLTGVNRAFPYADLDRDTVNARLGTLFHIARTSTFNVSIQALMLISQLSETSEGLPDRFYRALYEALLDSRLPLSSKQPLFLNLLFRALKLDRSQARVAAFVKRLIQTLCNQQTPYVIGALHLLGKIFTQMPSLYSMLPPSPTTEDEHLQIQDAAEDREGSAEIELNAQIVPSPATVPGSTEPSAEVLGVSAGTPYDPKAADPAKANAQGTYLWELVPLLQHFHPAVALHAHQLLQRQAMSTSQDLDHYTLSHFLDLFIYRDPKKSGAMRGASAMQPAAPGHDKTDRVALRKGVGVEQSEAVNNEKFWNLAESQVPPEQLFFHRFFNYKNEDVVRPNPAESRKRRRGSDSESDVDIADVAEGADQDFASDFDSDEEDEIWRVMKATLPRHEGNEDADGSDIDDDISLDLSQDEPQPEAEGSGEEGDSDAEETTRPFKSAFEPEADEAVSEDEEGPDFSEESLIGSDEEMDILLGGDDDEDASDAEQQEQRTKEKSNKRRKVKHLPTFATAEDYAALMGGSDDEGY